MERITKWYDDLHSTGGEDINKLIKEEFGPLLRFSCFYIRLEKNTRVVDTIQYISFVLLIFYNMFEMGPTIYYTRTNIILLSQSISITNPFIISVFNCLWFSYHRRLFNGFLKLNLVNFYDYKDSDKNDVVERLQRKGRLQRVAVLIIAPIWLGGCILLAMIITPMLDKYSGIEVDDQTIPELNRDMPFPIWTPVATDNVFVHILLVVSEILGAICLALGISASVSLYMYSAQQVVIQMEILVASLYDIDSRAKKLMRKNYPTESDKMNYEDPRFQACVKYCLKQNAQHHQKILEGFDQFKVYANLPVFIVNSCMSLQIAVSLLVMINNNAGYGSKLFGFFLLIAELGGVALVHFYGQSLTDVSFDYREAVYSIRWYNYHSSIKSMVTIMEERAARPLKFVAFSISETSWEAFSKICNTAYSFLNLMLAFEKN